MKRRDFFKGLIGVIAGFAIAPIVIKEIKETPNLCTMGDHVVLRGGWNCHNEPIVNWKVQPGENYHIVFSTTDGNTINSCDLKKT